MGKVLRYDPELTTSYGYYRCDTCGESMFAEGEKARYHKRGCPHTEKGLHACVYVIGPKVVEHVKGQAGHFGPSALGPVTGISLNMLYEQLPEVMQ